VLSGTSHYLYFAQRKPGGEWIHEKIDIQKTPDSYASQSFQVWFVVDQMRTVRAIYYDGTALAYIERSAGGAWTASQEFFQANGLYYINGLKLLLDQQNTMHLLWSWSTLWGPNQIEYASCKGRGSWSTPVIINANFLPAVAIARMAQFI